MATRKLKAIDLHVNGDCDCFSKAISPVDKACIYQSFPDGMEFITDTGKGQVRGEVFTPLFIVNKMITDNGLLPIEGVYYFDYTLKNLSAADKRVEYERIIRSRVVEPAVGSGNYTTTILWHKINYAYAYYDFLTECGEDVDVNIFYKFLLESLASLYAFDLDCGNVLVTRSRIMGMRGELNSDANISKHSKELLSSLDSTTLLKNKEIIDGVVAETVISSLNEAQLHWWDKLPAGGIINSLHLKFFGVEPPPNIMKKCSKIVEDNIKIFNGIVEDDTVEAHFTCPGTNNVYWSWWSVGVDLSLAFEKVSLRDQLNHKRIIELEEELEVFKREHYVLDESSLFALEVWDSKVNERFYNKQLKLLEVLKG